MYQEIDVEKVVYINTDCIGFMEPQEVDADIYKSEEITKTYKLSDVNEEHFGINPRNPNTSSRPG